MAVARVTEGAMRDHTKMYLGMTIMIIPMALDDMVVMDGIESLIPVSCGSCL